VRNCELGLRFFQSSWTAKPSPVRVTLIIALPALYPAVMKTRPSPMGVTLGIVMRQVNLP